MKGITPCFVQVKNPAKLKELIMWLADIKSPIAIWGFTANGNTVISNQTPSDAIISSNKGIDCGTNIELFKALAAMNDKNDFMQWFTNSEGDWLPCRGIDLLKEDEVPSVIEEYKNFWRKATAAEIVERFKNMVK